MKLKLWLKLEIIGVIVTFILGLFLHYSISISNMSIWAIVFGSVNQSIWEHAKSFSMPYIIWSLIELCIIRLPFKKFVVSKIIGLYSLVIGVILSLSIYLGLIGNHSFILDIAVSFIFIFIAYVVSYKLATSKYHLEELFVISLLMLVLFLSMYLTFSFVPPKINLFLDYTKGSYGMSL